MSLLNFDQTRDPGVIRFSLLIIPSGVNCLNSNNGFTKIATFVHQNCCPLNYADFWKPVVGLLLSHINCLIDSRSASLSFPRSSKLVFQFWLRLRFTAGRWDSISLNLNSFCHWSLQFACGRSNRRLSIIFQLQT